MMVLSLMHGSDSLVLSMGLTEGKCLCNEREEEQMQQGAPWSSEEVSPGSECAQVLEGSSGESHPEPERVLLRNPHHNSAMSASASTSTDFQLRQFKYVIERKTSTFLITLTSCGCVGQQKGWRHWNLWNCCVYVSIKAENHKFDSRLQ